MHLDQDASLGDRQYSNNVMSLSIRPTASSRYMTAAQHFAFSAEGPVTNLESTLTTADMPKECVWEACAHKDVRGTYISTGPISAVQSTTVKPDAPVQVDLVVSFQFHRAESIVQTDQMPHLLLLLSNAHNAVKISAIDSLSCSSGMHCTIDTLGVMLAL